MAGYTQQEQTDVVRRALALETAIAVGQADAELVRGRSFERFPRYEARQRVVTQEAGARASRAIDLLREQAHKDAQGAMLLQGVQIRGLQPSRRSRSTSCAPRRTPTSPASVSASTSA